MTLTLAYPWLLLLLPMPLFIIWLAAPQKTFARDFNSPFSTASAGLDRRWRDERSRKIAPLALSGDVFIRDLDIGDNRDG